MENAELLSTVRLISSWVSIHKTCHRPQPFRSANRWKLPRDALRNEASAGQYRLRRLVESQGLNLAAGLSIPALFGILGLWSRSRSRSRRLWRSFDSHFNLRALLEAYRVAVFVRQCVIDPNFSI